AITPDLLRREYDTYTKNFIMYDYAMTKLNERKQDIEESTYRKEYYQLQKLKRFAPNAYIADINEEFLIRLVRWCKKNCKNANSGTANTIKTVKYYYRKAKKDGLAKGNPFADIKVKPEVTNRDFATKEEVAQLIKLYKSNALDDSLQNVLRYFLFSVFTGLRYIDVCQFSRKHIIGETIALQMKKTKNTTGKVVKIPITAPVQALIGDISRVYTDDEPIFRVISSQKTNKYLKLIMQKAGVPKPLTFHCARHTFATRFLQENGEKIATLKELLGHSKIEQTLISDHVVYQDMTEAMVYANQAW
ncbi:MAG: tyrosine-type recombinase/integrase, partial [Bacteroidales bacterium]